MTRGQWLVLGGLGWGVIVVYACLVLIVTGMILNPDEPAVVVAAAEATGTATLRPTFTSTATPTSTFTPTPTATTTSTPTSTPTPTSTFTPTPVPRRPTPTPVPQQDTPTPVPQQDTPAVDFKLVKVRRLSPCENHGNHNIYIYVLDAQGKGISDVPLWVEWGGEGVELVTGRKPEVSPGFADFPMFKGTYSVEVMNCRSEVARGITPDIPVDEPCPETGNAKGNSLYHYSYEVVFQRTH